MLEFQIQNSLFSCVSTYAVSPSGIAEPIEIETIISQNSLFSCVSTYAVSPSGIAEPTEIETIISQNSLFSWVSTYAVSPSGIAEPTEIEDNHQSELIVLLRQHVRCVTLRDSRTYRDRGQSSVRTHCSPASARTLCHPQG